MKSDHPYTQEAQEKARNLLIPFAQKRGMPITYAFALADKIEEALIDAYQCGVNRTLHEERNR